MLKLYMQLQQMYECGYTQVEFMFHSLPGQVVGWAHVPLTNT